MIRHTMVVSCNKNGCRNEVVLTGGKITVRQLYKKTISSGWVWKNAKTQFCIDHRQKKAVKEEKVKLARTPRATAPTTAVAKPSKVRPTKPAPVIPDEVATSRASSGIFGPDFDGQEEGSN